MAQTQEISEDLRKQAVDVQTGKRYKLLSKQFGLHQSTVRHTE